MRSVQHADDGREILVDCWLLANNRKPAAIVQILHGLGEHPARYARFASACSNRDYAVIAHNHRGHGDNCPVDSLGHFADSDGWDRVVSDVLVVNREIRRRFAQVPLVLLGHSMGSYVAQDFLAQHPQCADALILSGSALPLRRQLLPGYLLSRIIAWRRGRRARSSLLNSLGFGAFNKPFAPNRTAFDWLSRDHAEVDRYLADPLCGADSSNGLWADLTGALLKIRKRSSMQRIPPGLPLLITGGEKDPVGGIKGMNRLADAYRRTGHGEVTVKIYADGRHEMFNETNREEFTADLLDWIGAKT
jgi:alpha-beta hydrolase superfamily lysophospholipase